MRALYPHCQVSTSFSSNNTVDFLIILLFYRSPSFPANTESIFFKLPWLLSCNVVPKSNLGHWQSRGVTAEEAYRE